MTLTLSNNDPLATILRVLFPVVEGEVRDTDNPGYHPPKVGPHDEWLGQTFRDMCGNDHVEMRLNFFLFRRNLYDPDRDC